MLVLFGWFLFEKLTAGPLHGVAPSTQSSTSAQAPTAADTPPLATSTPQTLVVDADSRRYENKTFHFSLVYPQELLVEEDTEMWGALTVTFQDPATNDGFEIYVTPYAQTRVTQERFTQDEPSGTLVQPTDVIIDNVRATMFFGSNSYMGDTREVWFIKDGFLYEVATYKELDSWLSQIMQTWKFI